MMAMETVELGVEVTSAVQKSEDNAPVSLDEIQIETPEERLLSRKIYIECDVLSHDSWLSAKNS